MKYYQSNREIVGLKIVLFKEEHGPRTHLFETKDGWLKIVKEVFEFRNKFNEYNWIPEMVEIHKNDPERFKKPVDLPDGSPDYAIAEYNKRKRQYLRHCSEREEYISVNKVLELARNGNVLAMEKILYYQRETNEGGYQNFDIEDITNYG